MINEKEIITKYMNLSKFLDLIQFKRFYFPSIYELNKICKWEGEITALTNIFESGIDKKLDYCLQTLNNISNSSKQNLDKNLFKPDPLNLPFNDKNKIKYEDYINLKKSINKKYKILCWHREFKESMAMWKIYSGEISIRIKTSIKDLKNSLKIPTKYMLSDSTVNYIHYNKKDEENLNKELDLMKRNFEHERVFFRPAFYEFEKEYRLLIHHKNFKEEVNPYIKVDLKKLIKEIRICPNCPEYIYENVKKLIPSNLKINLTKSIFD